MGSPAVPQERLCANESVEAIKEMMEYYRQDSFDALIGLEIGGSNGLLPLSIGSSKHFDRPVVDADWMGRLDCFRSWILRSLLFRSCIPQPVASHSRRA